MTEPGKFDHDVQMVRAIADMTARSAMARCIFGEQTTTSTAHEGDRTITTRRSFTHGTLVGVLIEKYWTDNDGRTFALAVKLR